MFKKLALAHPIDVLEKSSRIFLVKETSRLEFWKQHAVPPTPLLVATIEPNQVKFLVGIVHPLMKVDRRFGEDFVKKNRLFSCLSRKDGNEATMNIFVSWKSATSAKFCRFAYLA